MECFRTLPPLRKVLLCLYMNQQITTWNLHTFLAPNGRGLRMFLLSQLNPVYILHPISFRSISILSSHLRLIIPSGCFLWGFPTHSTLAFLFSPIRATFSAYTILLDLIITSHNIRYFQRFLCHSQGSERNTGNSLYINYQLDALIIIYS